MLICFWASIRVNTYMLWEQDSKREEKCYDDYNYPVRASESLSPQKTAEIRAVLKTRD